MVLRSPVLRTSFLAILLIAAGLTACDDGGVSPEPEEVEVTLEGTVTTTGAENPIEGAEVTAFPVEEGNPLDSTTTGEDGSYELAFTFEEAETPDQLRLEVEAEDFVSDQDTVDFSPEIVRDVELEVATMEATASGTATDVDSGDPIESATVTGTRTGTEDTLFDVTTGSDGTYEASFEVAEEPSEVTIRVEAGDYEVADTTVAFSQKMNTDFALEPATIEATASGLATDVDSGDPVEGASVTGTRTGNEDPLFEVMTDSNGTYTASFEVTEEPSEITVSAEADGYQVGETTVAFSEEISVDFALQIDGWVVTSNPYENVNWNGDHHKGNFHTHTTKSDGTESPRTMIDEYHSRDYDILALTDHNNVSWPWQLYGMIAVPGNELSRHDHNLSLFTTYEGAPTRLPTSIEEVAEAGGITVLAHPGRYWQPDGDRVPNRALEKYVGLFRTYDTLVGMEVHNQTDRYPHDRRLWDALLEEEMPEEPIWGFANDDSHGKSHIGRNANWFPLQDQDPDTSDVREAIEKGKFYFSTVSTLAEDPRAMPLSPKITGMDYDRVNKTLTLTAVINTEGTPADGPVEPEIDWISSQGEVVAEGETIDLSEATGLSTYLRAEIRSDWALTYTQPFGIEER